MLISEFAQRTGLTVDTIRFYVRRGLLVPETSSKGGRNPYQVFTAEHARVARIIRMAQTLGMSLKEIAAINAEHHAGLITPARSMAIMSDQLALLERRMTEMALMADYLRAKIAWLKSGEMGPEPSFDAIMQPARAAAPG